MTRYAENTVVSVEKSRMEIERLLQRYGCDDFVYRSTMAMAQIGFRMHSRMVRFDLELPEREDFRMTSGRRPRARDDAATFKAWEQGCRQRWRALALVIKAKLEAVETGITSFEVEFMAHMVVPGGKVFHEVALPQIAVAYETGRLPPLLGSGS